MIIRIIILTIFIISCSCGNKQKLTDNHTNINHGTKIHSVSEHKTVEPATNPKLKGNIPVVLRKIPHDSKAYTQGLYWKDGFLYESTGQRGQSTLRKINPENGEVIVKKTMPANYFAEGMTILNDKIYQLTWTSGECLIYDLKTMQLEASLNYAGEGWGLTDKDNQFYMSNGTNVIYVRDPDNFNAISSIPVYDGTERLFYINELEMIGDELFANIYNNDKVARINPATGEVNGWIDFSFLRKEFPDDKNAEVLNGIAYNEDKETIYITGKDWPFIFEIELTE